MKFFTLSLVMLLILTSILPYMGTGRSAGLADSPWPMFGGNAQHTGLSPYDTSGNNGGLLWRYKTDAPLMSSPAIGPDGTVYFGSYDNNLYALNPNGSLKWKHITGGYVVSSPAIGNNGTADFGSVDYYVYALNPDG